MLRGIEPEIPSPIHIRLPNNTVLNRAIVVFSPLNTSTIFPAEFSGVRVYSVRQWLGWDCAIPARTWSNMLMVVKHIVTMEDSNSVSK